LIDAGIGAGVNIDVVVVVVVVVVVLAVVRNVPSKKENEKSLGPLTAYTFFVDLSTPPDPPPSEIKRTISWYGRTPTT